MASALCVSMETKHAVQRLGLCHCWLRWRRQQSSVECRNRWLIATPTTATAPECQVALVVMLSLIKEDQTQPGKRFIFSLMCFIKLWADSHLVNRSHIVVELIVHLPSDPCLHPNTQLGLFRRHISLLPHFASDWQCSLVFLNLPVATRWYLPTTQFLSFCLQDRCNNMREDIGIRVFHCTCLPGVCVFAEAFVPSRADKRNEH